MTRRTPSPDAQAAAGDDLARALRLTTLSLAFGRVERATRHEDGRRPETDTDHTVMLALVACELAPPGLDRAKIAAFALVHDLPEVHAGDTQTLVISPEATAAKRDREDAARARLTAELGAGSWVASTLAAYEQQRVPEARFVRAVDKVLPKLTHAFNGCAAARALTDRAGFVEAHRRQLRTLREEYPEFPDVLELLRASMVHSEACWSDDAPTGDDLFGRLYAASNHGGDTTTLATGDVRGVVHAMQATDERIAHLESERERLTTDLARLRAPLAGDLAAIEARAVSQAAALDALRAEAREHGDDSYGYGICRVLSVLPRGVDPDVTALLARTAAHAAALDAAVAAARAEATAAERARCVAVCRAVATGWPGDDVAAARMALSEAREFIDDGLDADAAAARYDAALAAPRGR